MEIWSRDIEKKIGVIGKNIKWIILWIEIKLNLF